MSDPNAPDELPEAAGPHRVIGTPPPAEARALLGDGSGEPNGSPPAPPELPAVPSDLRPAKKAERIAAALFILSTPAGIRFIAPHVRLQVGSGHAVFRSNPAPAPS